MPRVTRDRTPPQLQQTTPADNATGVSSTSNLVLTFSENVKAGSGQISIYKSDGTLFRSIASTDTSQVTISGHTVTINPSVDLATGTSYYVLVGNGAIKDIAGNNYGGLSSSTAFNFTTAGNPPVDTTAPHLTNTSPADNAGNVSVGANLVLTFNEAVQAGTGTFDIHDANGSVVQISVADSSKVNFSGNKVTINPGSDLAPGTSYYVTFASDVVRDLANNAHAGIVSQTTFNFSTTDGYTDTTAPVLLFKSPNTSNIFGSGSQNIVLTFNEPVKAGTGVIEIRYTSDGSLYRTIPVTDTSQVIFSGRQVTIDPATDLASNASYTVVFAPGVIDDAVGHDFSGTTVNLSTFIAGGGVFATAIGGGSFGDLFAGNDVSLDITLLSFQEALNGTLLSVTSNRVDILGTDGLTYRVFGSDFNTAATTIGDVGGFQVTLVEAWAGSGGSAHIVYSYYTYEINLVSFGTFDLSYNLSGSDTFIGSSADDVLFGYGGGDTITGREGNDVINGGTGDDTIAGGLGADSLAGGAGYDTLKYASLAELNGDTINGFEGGDKIDLSGIGGLTFIGANAFSGAAGQVRYGSSGGNTILQVDSDGNGTADGSLTMSGVQVQLGETQAGSKIIVVTSEAVAPVLVSVYPSDNATNVDNDTPFYLTFSENVVAGTGSFEIRRTADNSLFDTLAVTDSRVQFQGNVVSFSPHTPLESSTAYYIKFAPGVVKDLFGNSNTGISDSSTFNFTTEFVPDVTAPVLLGATPVDNSINVAINANIVLTFSEPIVAGFGSFMIAVSFNGVFRLIPASDTTQVQISGNTVTINPNVNLLPGKHYEVYVDPDAVRDLSGNGYAGYQSPTLLDFTTASSGGDITKPQFVSATPALDATGVSVATNITVTFNEAVQAGYGKLLLGGPDGLAQTIDVRDTSQVTFSGNTMTINPSVNLNPGWWYSLEFPTFGVVTDLAGNGFGGLAGRPDIWFTTQDGPDLSPPTLAWSVPADNDTGVNPLASISLVFSEAIQAGSGNIEIRKSSDNSLVENIAVSDERVSIFGKTLTIDPNAIFALGTSYYVTFGSGLVRDLANNNVAGVGSPVTLNFTIQHPTTAPDLVSITPGDNAANVAVSSNIVLTFDENVVAGSGVIEIRRPSDGGLFASLSVTDASQVTFSGSTVTLNPSSNLQPGTEYFVWFGSGVVKDAQGNSFGGIEQGAFNFTTATGGAANPPAPGGLTGTALVNTLVGGSGNDVITGLGQADTLTGAGGSDTFVYTAASDSTGRTFDVITDFNASADLFDLWFQVTGVDTAITGGSLSSRSFDSDLAAAVGSSTLAANHAVLFMPNGGTYAGKTFLVIDANGSLGYQSTEDMVILLGGASSLGGLSATDFV